MVVDHKIAVVTGANRGIGHEICRQLAKLNIQVVLTSRNREKGEAACKLLRDENLDVLYHQLDVTDEKSIHDFCDNIQEVYGRCDILINNAGIFPEVKDTSDDVKTSVFSSELKCVHRAMETNVYGPLLLCQEMVPLMRTHQYGRIINISSSLGQLATMNAGFPAYRISKTALNVLTRILASELKEENIIVNSMCPGWCRTDMGGPQAPRSVEEGAETAIWLATLPDDGPRGGFFKDKQRIEW
ncbi:MAG: SDR family oxidoreductase [Candidatus Omnitrophica bacterium]|nr:SDR family oxidoreductase [Candidatus Omnitrophota bacterium]